MDTKQIKQKEIRQLPDLIKNKKNSGKENKYSHLRLL